MIHSSYTAPRVIPVNGSGSWAEIDRLQDMSGSLALNREKINEIGRDGTVDWKVGIPSVSLNLRQLEYGNFEFWKKLTNQADAADDIDLNDFKTSMIDICGYKTDDTGTFLGTVFYPKLRCAGFGLNIGDPTALVERSFSLVGEDEILYEGSNKYVIYFQATGSATTNFQIVFGSGDYSDYPDPVADPDASGTQTFIRIMRYRGTTDTELVEGTDFTYDAGTTTINITGNQAADLYKVWYTAATYITNGSTFTVNDSDKGGLVAENCSIFLNTSNYVYRLQSVGVDVSFDRQDVREIGNQNVVARGIRSKTVRVTLGRILEAYTIEELFRGVSSSYGKLDPRKYLDNLSLTIKIYNEAAKTTFKMGYKFSNLSPTNRDLSVPTKDYLNQGATLEGEEGVITSNIADL